MLSELKIENFKGIEDSSGLKDFAKINLFIGKNDSGKSTILEAAYYLFQELYNPPRLSSILSRRTNVFSGSSELWFDYKTGNPIVISATFQNVRLDWRISVKQTPTEPIISSSVFGGSRQLVLLGETQYRGRDFSMTVSSGKTLIDNLREDDKFKKYITKYASGMSLIDCTLKSNTSEVESILARFKRIPAQEKMIGEALGDIYGKGKVWEFVPQLEIPDQKRLAFSEAGMRKYFSGFGDGLRYSVGILGSALGTSDSALFIEEIESHQHSGSLRKLIKHLVSFSRVNNQQIFLSTHIQDVWLSLHRGIYLEDVEKEQKEFRCFLVERDEKTGKVSAEQTDDVQKITRALEE